MHCSIGLTVKNVLLEAIKLNVIMVSVVMLSVAAPWTEPGNIDASGKHKKAALQTKDFTEDKNAGL